MAERALLAHPVDVLQQIDPSLVESDIDSDDYLGNRDREQLRARIDSAASESEDLTGHAFRRNRIGSPNAPETYKHQNVEGRNRREPLRVNLDYRPVLPFDSSKGDVLEIRTGKDDWDDVTDDADDTFVLHHRTGHLEIYRILFRRIYWDARDNRYLRTTYRYGGLGGSQYEGGETTLDGSIESGETSVSVSNAARLPNRGILLVGNSEYVRLTDVDYSTDTITVSRGKQMTSARSHDDGSVVHFCPENVRTAVASKVAIWALNNEHWVTQLANTGSGIDLAEKKADLKETWEQTLGNHSEVRRL